MQTLVDLLPPEAKDTRLNLKALETGTALTTQQLWGTVFASALASRDAELTRAAGRAAAAHLPEQALAAVQTVAAIMAMTNVYYRFLHLASNGEYGKLPARLRMQGLQSHGVHGLDAELWALAVSAINGCGACVDAHEKKIRAEGGSAALVQDTVRVAAIVHAAASVLDGARALG